MEDNEINEMSGTMVYQQDFLWFTYFGITWTKAKANKDNALASCCNRAYRDLSRTLKYTHSTSALDPKNWKGTAEEKKAYISLKTEYKDKVRKHLCDQCKDIPKGEKQFNSWHEAACQYIIDESKKCIGLFKKPLTYGQAQKWVNMTLKNMLVTDLWGMDDFKQYMHIPLDSYIFKAAKRELGVLCPFNSWSEIDNYKEYLNYQNIIKQAAMEKKHKIALDWEGPAWIDQSEIENQYG